MKGSSNRIDFSLRPAKHAERRMLGEVFRRLRPFHPVEDYSYIGFGSLWFSDFSFFHRSLGLTDMLSMERDASHKPRFDDNKPFAAIGMDYRESSAVLPNLNWAKPAYVWLDYDDPLKRSMLLDTQTITTRCTSGTILAITVQCQGAKELDRPDPAGPSPIARFRESIGPDAVPPDASEMDLDGWSFGKLSQRILEDQIEAALAIRNLNIGQYDRMNYTPICDIEYKDGAKMRTFVGIFATVRDQHKVEQCGFDNLDFLPTNVKSIRIDVPVLTTREIRFLERQLPANTPMDYGSIPKDHADNFAKFYRYLPNFAVLEH